MSEIWNFDYPKIARESGFHFQQYNDGIFDWRLIGSIEVERILNNQNIEKLDNVITHLSEAPLGALLQSQILESGVAKYFILSQLAIQYLLFCKKFLDETLTSVRDSIQELQSENLRLTKLQQENSIELLQLHKELQQLKSISEIVYPCSMCTKNFVNNEMLKVHFARKHSSETSDKKPSDKENDKNLISTIKLELEIKHLKERLNDAERQFRKGNNYRKESNNIIIPSPRETLSTDHVNLKNIGIQSEIVRVTDKGIQSNLSEDKETDDIVQFEQTEILEIFTKLSKKIEILEKNKEIETQNNKQSLVKIEEKLLEVQQDLEAKSLRENDTLNNVVSKINTISNVDNSKDIENMKDYLTKTVAQIQEQNIDQINRVVEKIDLSCSEKLLNLKKDIESLGLLKSSIEKDDVVKTNKDIQDLSILPIKHKIIKRPVTFSLEEVDDSESCSYELSADETKEEDTDDLVLKEISTTKPHSETILNKTELRKEAIKMKTKYLKSLGITSSTTSLPTNLIPEIISLLTEKRMLKKKIFPNFYATRNQIKKTIENISINKKKDLKIQATKKNIQELEELKLRSTDIGNVDKYSKEYSTGGQSQKYITEKLDQILSSRENKFKKNDNTNEFLDQFNATQVKKEFDVKLEHILSSPIRKLEENQYGKPSGFKQVSRSSEKITDNLIKPIPAPRKKMYDLENYCNTSMDSSDDGKI